MVVRQSPPPDPLAGAEAMGPSAAVDAGRQRDARILPGPAIEPRGAGGHRCHGRSAACLVRWDPPGPKRVQAIGASAPLMPCADRQPWPDVPIEQVQAALLEGLREQGAFRPARTKSSRQLQERSAYPATIRRQLPDRLGTLPCWPTAV